MRYPKKLSFGGHVFLVDEKVYEPAEDTFLLACMHVFPFRHGQDHGEVDETGQKAKIVVEVKFPFEKIALIEARSRSCLKEDSP